MKGKALDNIDLQIINVLRGNARLRIYDIAKLLGQPASTVHSRIKRMESGGAIRKWTIVPDWGMAGMGVKAYVLVYVNTGELKGMGKTQKDLGKSIRKIPNVLSVDMITGEADLIVEVRAGDIRELEEVLLGKLQSIKGIVKTKTILCLHEVG